MCELTGAKNKTGKGRILQLTSYGEDSFPRFINLEKKGRGRYLVSEIYDQPIGVQDLKKSGNASVYFKYIELMFLRYISEEFGDDEIIFSRRELLLLIGAINLNYYRVDNIELISNYNGIVTAKDIKIFYSRCNSKLNRILNTALKNLSNRKLIGSIEKVIICKIGKYKNMCVVATPEERKIILEIEYDTMHKYNCESMKDIYNKKVDDKYFADIKKEILEKYNWSYYYKAYGIVFNHKNIEKYISRLQHSFDDALFELNGKIIDSLNKEAETIYERQTRKYNNIYEKSLEHPEILYKFATIDPLHENFIEAQKILAEELISVSDENNRADMYDIINMVDTNIYRPDDPYYMAMEAISK